MRLNFVINQSLGNVGEKPLMFHGSDNKARIVSRTNDAYWIRECPTPMGDWEDVVIGEPEFYEGEAKGVTLVNLSYESGYNGIYTWDTDVWYEEGRRFELALLLDDYRPPPPDMIQYYPAIITPELWDTSLIARESFDRSIITREQWEEASLQ